MNKEEIIVKNHIMRETVVGTSGIITPDHKPPPNTELIPTIVDQIILPSKLRVLEVDKIKQEDNTILLKILHYEAGYPRPQKSS